MTPHAYRRSRADDRGVTAIVGAILVTGILVGTLVTVRLSFVPVWEENAEAAHMQQVDRELSSLNADLDRLVGNQTASQLAVPLSLQGKRGSMFGPGPSAAGLELVGGSDRRVNVSASILRIQEQNGTILAGVNEDWQNVAGATTIEDVGQVLNFRLRIDEIGKTHNGDTITVTLTDGNGDVAGSFEAHQETNPPDSDLYYTVTSAGGTTLYDNANAIHNANDYGPYWIDLINPEFRFDKVLASAAPPINVALIEGGGFTGDFTITYKELAGAGSIVVGGGGTLVNDYARTFPAGGALVYRAANHYFVDQVYTLENGGLILDQDDGAVFRIEPKFDAVLSGSRLGLTISLPTLSTTNNTFAGDASSNVQLTARSHESLLALAPDLSMRITTNYPSLWATLWRTELLDAGLSGCTSVPPAGCHFHILTGPDWAQLRVFGTTPVDADPANPTYDLSITLQQATIRTEVRR